MLKFSSDRVFHGATPPTLEQFDSIWFPQRLLATDELAAGIYRMPRGTALCHRYIESNPQEAISNLLLVDIGHSDELLRALWDGQESLVETRENGQEHAVWAFTEPITRTESASRKAITYAASVGEGLRRSVGGEKSSSGLMTKNPLHTDWDARTGSPTNSVRLTSLLHGWTTSAFYRPNLGDEPGGKPGRSGAKLRHFRDCADMGVSCSSAPLWRPRGAGRR
ncbi:replication initiation protein [Corynebacterium sp. CCM 9203]|uniref:replication initiation protein n=1 Tax=Corynebacterium sp. CCM 9203 TaxID=3057615 RepID=UPI0035257276